MCTHAHADVQVACDRSQLYGYMDCTERALNNRERCSKQINTLIDH